MIVVDTAIINGMETKHLHSQLTTLALTSGLNVACGVLVVDQAVSVVAVVVLADTRLLDTLLVPKL